MNGHYEKLALAANEKGTTLEEAVKNWKDYANEKLKNGGEISFEEFMEQWPKNELDNWDQDEEFDPKAFEGHPLD